MGIFAMPSLGADMEAGTLVEWLVKPGDEVHRGDVVAVVETQKGAIEIECFQDGKVQELQADLGATLPVGAPLALILGPGETAPEPKKPKAADRSGGTKAGRNERTDRHADGGNAQGHCRGDGAVQADDPAFLPVRNHRRAARARVGGRPERRSVAL